MLNNLKIKILILTIYIIINMLFIEHFFVEFMVSEIPRVSVFGQSPYSVTFPYCTLYTI